MKTCFGLIICGFLTTTVHAATPASFAGEPSARDVQDAALKFFNLSKTTIDQLRADAENKAWLPVFELNGGLAHATVDDTSYNNELFGLDEPWVVRGVSGNARDLRAKLAWNFPQLMFNPETLDVSALSGRAEAVLKEVTGLYYQRRRLQMDLANNPPKDEETKMTKELRLEELTSLLDAMTGGWFQGKLQGG